MITLFVYALPFLISAILILTYFIAPDFYEMYVLSGLNREAQVVELLTFLLALFSSLILFKNFSLLFRLGKEYRLSAAYLFIIGLAVFFFAGEESSWGQSYFFWKTPESYDCIAVETNLHNTKLPIHALGNLFIFFMFIFLPVAFRKNLSVFSRVNLKSWVLPNTPVIFILIYGILWKSLKSLFHVMYTKEILTNMPFYVIFLEQINEQRELFLTIAFFIYALYMDFEVKKASSVLKAKNR